MELKAGEWYRRDDDKIVQAKSDRTEFKAGGYCYSPTGHAHGLAEYHLVEHIPRTDARHPEYEPCKWFEDSIGDRFVLIEGFGGELIRQFQTHITYEITSGEKTPLPDCTGWDWKPPAAEPAIDPGEGWRLLQKSEIVVQGDEYKCYDDGNWWPCKCSVGHLANDTGIIAYRRRIEPATRKVYMITWLCESGGGQMWTYDTGAGNQPPQHATGIIKRWTAEVEDMPS